MSFFDTQLPMTRRDRISTARSGKTQAAGGLPVGKIRSQAAGNRRTQFIHPKDSDLVVDSEKFRVI
jgi:hypothetical protein